MKRDEYRSVAGRARAEHQPVQIGNWVLYPDLAVLRRDNQEKRLNPKCLHVLLVLVSAGERGVSRMKLLDDVWGNTYPSDGVVSRAIADLRAAFGEKAGEHKYIRTLPKYGYQLVAELHPWTDTLAKPPPDTRLNIKRVLWSSAVVLGAAAGALLFKSIPNSPAAPNTGITHLGVSQPLSAAPGIEHQPRLSPDGNWVIYAAQKPGQADWDLLRVSTKDGTHQPVAIARNVNEHGPSYSPRGDEVAYVRLTSERCDVVVQSVALGKPESLAQCTNRFPTLVDWSGDGQWLAFTGTQENDSEQLRRIYAVHRHDHNIKRLTSRVSETGTDYYPRFSPSGQQLAFLRGEPQPDHRASLWLTDLESGNERQLSQQPMRIGGMTWRDESTLLYSVIDAGRFQARQLNLATMTEQLIDQTDLLHMDFNIEHQLLVAAELRRDQDLTLQRADGTSRTIARSTADDWGGQISPDEQWITFISKRSGFDELWITDIDGQAVRQLTRFEGATLRYPVWHPKGQRILFTAQTDADEQLYQIDIVSGAIEQFSTQGVSATTPQWMPDGQRWVYGCHNHSNRGICISDGEQEQYLANNLFKPQPIDSDSLIAMDKSGFLHRLDIATGDAISLEQQLPGNGRFGWALSGDDIYYLTAGDQPNSGRLMHRALSRAEPETVLFEGTIPLTDIVISIGNISKQVLFTSKQVSNDDLVIFRGISAGSG